LLAETGFAGPGPLLDWLPYFAASIFIMILPIRIDESRYPGCRPAKPKT
jgi:hypothetical protein